MSKFYEDLPEECWELIVNRLDHYRYLESLSLLSKRFLSLTNRLRFNLTVSDPLILNLNTLPKLLLRFPQLKHVKFSDFHGDLDLVLSQIARSGLYIETLDISGQERVPIDGIRELGKNMKSLKSLICSKMRVLEDRDVVAIAESLPWLEELDIGCSDEGIEFGSNVSDASIEVISNKAKHLKRISLSGNCLITDNSLKMLSLGCGFLREIEILNCCCVTENGIGFVLGHSHCLVSISTCVFPGPHSSLSRMENAVVSAKNLQSLELSRMAISDHLLDLIAASCLPLKSFALSHCFNSTAFGVFSILRAYPLLVYLNLEGAHFLTDRLISDWSDCLPDLRSIKLSYCWKLTNSTLFILASHCPLLEEIEMGQTSLGKENFDVVRGRSYSIRSLKLPQNEYLDDESLTTFAATCPNLGLLDVKNCSGVTDRGVREALENCADIRHLDVSGCEGVMGLGLNMDVSKLNLEVLQAKGSSICDEGLVNIGKWGSRLLQLDLEQCVRVTTTGVKGLMENCRELRKINLQNCPNVSAAMLAWMVFSMPMLRKMILPRNQVLTESQRSLFLRHGCLVCNA
ncbi:hypothetical protein RJ641_024367 [Dillenia turbinata]|uniref:F-box domain-containing protein n=1 Tax=Dillenia turbinata TaxID=194707 RepID=A0AAN8UGD1_9MAGN